jgi:hypothetical protein
VTSEDVDDHIGGMDVVGHGLSAGGFDCCQSIGEHRGEECFRRSELMRSPGPIFLGGTANLAGVLSL